MKPGLFAETRRALDVLQDRVERAGGPCHTCKHGSKRGGYSWSRPCRHPLTTRGHHDAVSGKITWEFGEQDKMRSGACGLEGRLHERASYYIIVWRWLCWQWWIFLACGVAAYFGLLAWAVSR